MAVVLTMAATVLACSSDSHNEGSSCKTVDDCGGGLSCQPVTGRQGDFCCPTPADSSSEGNCHAAAAQ